MASHRNALALNLSNMFGLPRGGRGGPAPPTSCRPISWTWTAIRHGSSRRLGCPSAWIPTTRRRSLRRPEGGRAPNSPVGREALLGHSPRVLLRWLVVHRAASNYSVDLLAAGVAQASDDAGEEHHDRAYGHPAQDDPNAPTAWRCEDVNEERQHDDCKASEGVPSAPPQDAEEYPHARDRIRQAALMMGAGSSR